jgi:O-antigen/teichoic acid export membrane protein
MDTKEQADSYSSILKYTALFGGVQGLAIVVGLVRNKIIAVLLGTDGMGLQSLFNSTIKLVSDSTNMGISMSAVKYLSSELSSGDDDKINGAVKVIRSWSFLAALIGFFALHRSQSAA